MLVFYTASTPLSLSPCLHPLSSYQRQLHSASEDAETGENSSTEAVDECVQRSNVVGDSGHSNVGVELFHGNISESIKELSSDEEDTIIANVLDLSNLDMEVPRWLINRIERQSPDRKTSPRSSNPCNNSNSSRKSSESFSITPSYRRNHRPSEPFAANNVNSTSVDRRERRRSDLGGLPSYRQKAFPSSRNSSVRQSRIPTLNEYAENSSSMSLSSKAPSDSSLADRSRSASPVQQSQPLYTDTHIEDTQVTSESLTVNDHPSPVTNLQDGTSSSPLTTHIPTSLTTTRMYSRNTTTTPTTTSLSTSQIHHVISSSPSINTHTSQTPHDAQSSTIPSHRKRKFSLSLSPLFGSKSKDKKSRPRSSSYGGYLSPTAVRPRRNQSCGAHDSRPNDVNQPASSTSGIPHVGRAAPCHAMEALVPLATTLLPRATTPKDVFTVAAGLRKFSDTGQLQILDQEDKLAASNINRRAMSFSKPGPDYFKRNLKLKVM